MKLFSVFKFICCFIIILCCFNYKSYAEADVKPQKILFSSRNTAKGKEQELFVINDNNVFVRTIKGSVFQYNLPEDGEYKLEGGANLLIQDGKIADISGSYYSVINDDATTHGKYKDEFFCERTHECDIMKFDVINNLFIKRETIDGFQTQLYLLDYYELLKLVFFRSQKDSNGKRSIYAFVFSEKNEVGCSYFYEYKIYKPPVEKENGNKKKKNKKKKIVAKTVNEFMQKVATESYKKMMLEDYVYLQPFQNDDVNKIVVYINGAKVEYLNAMAVDLKWKQLSLRDILHKPIAKENIKEKKQTTNKQQQKGANKPTMDKQQKKKKK